MTGDVTPLNGLLTHLVSYFNDNEDQLGRLIAYTIGHSLFSNEVKTKSDKHLKYEQMRLLYLDLEDTIKDSKRSGISKKIHELKTELDPFIADLVQDPEMLEEYESQPLLVAFVNYLQNSQIPWQDNLRRIGIKLNKQKNYSTNIRRNKRNFYSDYKKLEQIFDSE